MLIRDEELKSILNEAFDAGFQSPLEMMEPEIEGILFRVKSRYAVQLPATDSWLWGDYIRSMKSPDPWLIATT